MAIFDAVALAVFVLCWLFFEPLLNVLARGRRVINADMVTIRAAWMKGMARREQRIVDSQFLGHSLNSASFFASANLIVIAAAAGVLFGGEAALQGVEELEVLTAGPEWLFDAKLALVVATLARGLLDFVWSIRQLNYCLAAIGAMPDELPVEARDRFADAFGAMLNPALKGFSRGVRSYYFALAAAAWLFGPAALLAATVGAVALLTWRQAASPAAAGIRQVHALLEESERERAGGAK